MDIDLGSFAFGSSIESGVGTPSWGTSLGQSRPDYKFTYPGAESILIGMVYCSVPLEYVFLPLGRGGRVVNAHESPECQLASEFKKVYINGAKIEGRFLIVLINEISDSHEGRRSIKYSDKISYNDESNGIYYSNADFIKEARKTLGLSEDACWFIYRMEVINQDELHMYSVIVDQNGSKSYENSSSRRTEWISLIPHADSDYIVNKTKNKDNTGLQEIFYGAPGTGKSYVVKEKTKDESVIRTTFHPDSDYSTFVGAYKPTTRVVRSRDMAGHVIMEHGKEVTEDRIIYEFVDQAFLQAYIKAWKYMSDTEDGKEPKKQYLVIEEINRGNCAQIFGDLFQLLDRNYEGFSDYFIEADSDMQKRLKKAFEGFNLDSKKEDINSMYYEGRDVVQEVLDGKILLLPNNLYIWATMNTSDQSLFPIDSAFKRRWDWKYITISEGRDNYGNPLDWSIACGNKSYSWWSFLEKINALIGSTTKSEDKKLGYFFCKAQDGVISAEKFVGKVVFYLWNDVFNDFEFADTAFDDPEDTKNPKLTFDKFFTTNEKKGIKPVAEDKVELFLKNLGVSIISSNDIDENMGDEEGNEKNERDKSRYSVNGEGVFNKGDTAYKVLEKYINSYPDKTPEDIVAAWKGLNLSDVRHIVETKEEFDQRTQGSSDSNPRAKKCPCGEGKEVYLTTQWGIGNFPYFVEAVNSANWGITINKIQ